MKGLAGLNLTDNERAALLELKANVRERYPEAEIILYGSKARGDSEQFSDIDILVLLNRDVNDSLREEIYSLSFKIELKYDVLFGILVESRSFWNSDLGMQMPIHWSIDKEGISIMKDF